MDLLLSLPHPPNPHNAAWNHFPNKLRASQSFPQGQFGRTQTKTGVQAGLEREEKKSYYALRLEVFLDTHN